MLRFRWSSPIVFGLAAGWNLFFAFVAREKASGPILLAVGALASILFGYFAVRGLVNRTRVSLAQGKLRIDMGPMWPRTHEVHELLDIAGFIAEPVPVNAGHGHVVSLITRTNARVPLGIKLNGLMLTVKGSTTPFMGVAPPDHAIYVASRLDEALDIVRHEGGQYRIAPGLDEGTPRSEPPAEVEESGGRRDQRGDVEGRSWYRAPRPRQSDYRSLSGDRAPASCAAC